MMDTRREISPQSKRELHFYLHLLAVVADHENLHRWHRKLKERPAIANALALKASLQ